MATGLDSNSCVIKTLVLQYSLYLFQLPI